MSDTYVSKVNDKPLAASEATPSSPLATVIAGKQDSLGINPTSGNASLFLNEQGQFVSTATQDTKAVRHVVIDNYLQIEIQRGNNHRNASITIFGDSGAYPFIANIGFQFLTNPGSDESAGFHTAPVLSMVEANNLGSNSYVPNVWYINNGSSGSSYIYCKWPGNKRLTLLLNTFAPGAIVISDVSSLPSGAVAAANGHSIPHVTGINTAVGSSTVPVYVSAAGEILPATGVAPGHVAYERTNEINYANVPTTGNKNRHWFNYRNGDTGDPDPNNTVSAYYFGNRNYSTAGVYLNAEGFSPTCITGLSGENGKNFVPFVKFTLTNTGSAQGLVAFRCVVMRANSDDYIGLVDILVKIRQNSWYAVAMKCVRGGQDSIDEYGSFGNGVYWESGSTIFYLGVRTSSFSSKVSVFVQNMPLNDQNATLNGTGSFTLGDYTSEVSSLTEQNMYTRDLSLGRALYGTSGERMAYAYNPSALGSGSPVADAEAYWTSLAAKTEQIVYNNRGTEYTLFLSKSNPNNGVNYGSILRWGYDSPYLEMLRVHQDNWMSSDWETICPPSVLCFEYTTDTDEKAKLSSALSAAIRARKIGTSTSYKNRRPIIFLHKDANYFMLTYRGGSSGTSGGTSVWQFQHSPHNGQSSVVNGYIFYDSWSGDTHTYSWSTISSTAFTADLYLKTGSDTYYAGSGNATIDITDATSTYYLIVMNGSAVFTLDTGSGTTVHTLLVCRRRTSDPCASVTIQWRSMTGSLQEMIVNNNYSTLAYSHEIIFDVWIRKVSTPGGSTYAIATVTPQAPRFVDMLADKTNWGNNDDDFENGVFGMTPNYFS
ncbi:MAG: hypothetical protein IK038_02475 [Bacteroidaceae bacterium]|nr:hypothetical protein [Bacteroidaceae bacterium]